MRSVEDLVECKEGISVSSDCQEENRERSCKHLIDCQEGRS
jgi:hypothetical protein